MPLARPAPLGSAADLHRTLLRSEQLDDAFQILRARELARAKVYGPRWKLLSDAGGLAVALMIDASQGQATVGAIAARLEACGLASRSRVHALTRTIIHLGGVTVSRSNRDARARLLAPSGWLPAFIDDWLGGYLCALAMHQIGPIDASAARARLGQTILERPTALFRSRALGWITHAVGGGLWLLSLLASARRMSARILVQLSLKDLARTSGLSRAHYAYLRALAEQRGLVRRQGDGAQLELTSRFWALARGLVAGQLAVIGA